MMRFAGGLLGAGLLALLLFAPIPGGLVAALFDPPHEFERFGVSIDESRERFTEGMEQVRQLLEQPVASSTGRFRASSSRAGTRRAIRPTIPIRSAASASGTSRTSSRRR